MINELDKENYPNITKHKLFLLTSTEAYIEGKKEGFDEGIKEGRLEAFNEILVLLNKHKKHSEQKINAKKL